MNTSKRKSASSPTIMVIGIGGGGCNAVNQMYRVGIDGVRFAMCGNLRRYPLITREIYLGRYDMGAMNCTELEHSMTESCLEEVKEELMYSETKMLFTVAVLGGGVGGGAIPIISSIAKQMGILTVAVVTLPFKCEGERVMAQAMAEFEAIHKSVDSVLIINSDDVVEVSEKSHLCEAFEKIDDVLVDVVRVIPNLIFVDSMINIDFADVQSVMKDSGIALVGYAHGGGENRAQQVTQAAMSSPLLQGADISEAKNVLLNITSGTKEVTMAETYEITELVQSGTSNADILWGAGTDESLSDDIRITVIATGFEPQSIPALQKLYKTTK